MQSKPRALEDASTALDCLGLSHALPALHAAGVRISRTVLGGSHSVAVYPPIDSLTSLDGEAVFDAIDCGREASLYVHIAFCETRCTFCHYVVEHYSRSAEGRVASYLDALKQELVCWGQKLARSGTAVSSIYIGGGTPLVLGRDVLLDLLTTIYGEYDVLAGAEVCIEGSPLTITAPGGEDKLRFLKEQGVTRLSFGVQSFDDEVLKYAARGYRRDVPIQAALIARDVFDNWNLDLIQGLYKGSPSETWTNLEAVAGLLPPHLTWYHGRFADRPQGDWYRAAEKHASFEDEYETLLGRMLIWQQLAALGYRQTDGNRFVRDDRFSDRFKPIRTSSSSTLVGVGAASYSHVPVARPDETCRGYMFRNESDISAYIDSVAGGGIPIATGRRIDESEVLATSYATGLRSGRVEDEDLCTIRQSHRELSCHYERLESSLLEIGVLESFTDRTGRTGVRLSELGRLFEDETLSLFFSPAVQHALSRRSVLDITRGAGLTGRPRRRKDMGAPGLVEIAGPASSDFIDSPSSTQIGTSNRWALTRAMRRRRT